MNQKKIQTPAERAQQITEELWKVSEEYHAGAIGHDEFSRRSLALHAASDREGISDLVRERLRIATNLPELAPWFCGEEKKGFLRAVTHDEMPEDPRFENLRKMCD